MKKHSYLANGTYGCIIKPGIICHNFEERRFKGIKTISKLFASKEEWKDEVRIQLIVENEIDKDSIFTVKMLEYCEKNSSILGEIDGIYKCGSLGNSDNKIYQIVYPFGGIDLNNLVVKFNVPEVSLNFRIDNALPSMINIFEGIEKMVNANYIHHDIKINNILYDINFNKFTLIDFGFFVKIEDTFDYRAFLLEEENPLFFIFYPVEYNLMYYAYMNNSNYSKMDAKKLNLFLISEQLIPLITTICNDKYKFKKEIRDKINNIKKTLKFYLDNCSNIISFFSDASKDKLKPTKSDIDNYIISISQKHSINKIDIRHKIDVYMFGNCLLYFLLYSLINLNEENGIFKIPLELFDLVLKMIDSNPFTRISIQQAIIEYKHIFSL